MDYITARPLYFTSVLNLWRALQTLGYPYCDDFRRTLHKAICKTDIAFMAFNLVRNEKDILEMINYISYTLPKFWEEQALLRVFINKLTIYNVFNQYGEYE